MARSPYAGLDERCYWRSAVGEAHPLAPRDIYRKKYAITAEDRIATAGSCFAQHIARNLRKHKYMVVDAEPAPDAIPDSVARDFGYGLYSARYGNVYTVRQMLQLIDEAHGRWQPDQYIWTKGDRFFDALRPSVEPTGLSSPQEVREHREQHLAAVRSVFSTATVFVFTLGLTEGWVHAASGTVFPTAPGTIAGDYDPDVFTFHNFRFDEVLADLRLLRTRLQEIVPGMRMLLTVSPVPLTATADDNHILVSTVYSKSVLRAAAGQMAAEHEDVDYFPFFEIIAGHPSRGFFYEPNLRSVADEGVDVVMRTFFAEHPPLAIPESPGHAADLSSPENQRKREDVEATREERRIARQKRLEERAAREATRTKSRNRSNAVVCEEELLEAFTR
jgi:hypothetical protein